jgi:class 3 adenylate cyclase
MAAVNVELRAGVHTGEVERREDGDIGGMAVHVGARIMGLAGAGEILVSRTVADLLTGSGTPLEDRGEHDLKGVPGRWQVLSAR